MNIWSYPQKWQIIGICPSKEAANKNTGGPAQNPGRVINFYQYLLVWSEADFLFFKLYVVTICVGRCYLCHFIWNVYIISLVLKVCISSQYPRISHTPYPIHRFTWVSFQSQEYRKELGVLPYCCSLYTWEPRDPRMLPWYSGMIGPKERWSNITWSWSLNSPADSIIKGHFMRSGWFSWHQYCWAGELEPPKRIKCQNHRPLPFPNRPVLLLDLGMTEENDSMSLGLDFRSSV